MSTRRPFRFAGSLQSTSTGREFGEGARRIEALGYDTLLLADHFEQGWFAVGPALVAAATATTALRVGSLVYSNNFRHPALLAREAATIDVLSNGRLELGIGAGYQAPEYAQTGINLPPPGERVERLRETLAVIKGLWAPEPFTAAGKYYTINDMEGWPKPLQQPHPPIQVGGGGRRMLTVAAQEADIVGIIAQSTPSGHLFGQDTHALVDQKVAWVREAAGDRFDQLELAALVMKVTITNHRHSAAGEIAAEWGTVTPEQVLASPYFLLGSVAGIVEDVQRLREEHGISYLTVFPTDVEAFAPVVAQLAGT